MADKKILHTYRYTGQPWKILQSVVPQGFCVKTLEEPTRECLLREVEDADYLLVSGRLAIDSEVLAAASRLRMIQRTGVGTEMLDKPAIAARGIPVYVNAGINARSVAEHTLTLMLCALKNIPHISNWVKQGIWQKQATGVQCHEIYGKTVGLVGLGAIGRRVAAYLRVMGAHVCYTDPFRATADTERELGLTYLDSFDKLLPLCDILSFHCPLTPDNERMLNAAALAAMRPGAVVVNTARGKLIDEDALYDALVDGRIRCAALDVHYEEPVPASDRLATLDNVIMTPHIGGLSFEAFHDMMAEAIQNIVDFDQGHFQKISQKILKLS